MLLCIWGLSFISFKRFFCRIKDFHVDEVQLKNLYYIACILLHCEDSLPNPISDFWWLNGKGSSCQCRRHRKCSFNPWVRKSPWSRKWETALLFLPGKSRGQRGLVGFCPLGCKESDMTERTYTHTYLNTNLQSIELEGGYKFIFTFISCCQSTSKMFAQIYALNSGI